MVVKTLRITDRNELCCFFFFFLQKSLRRRMTVDDTYHRAVQKSSSSTESLVSVVRLRDRVLKFPTKDWPGSRGLRGPTVTPPVVRTRCRRRFRAIVRFGENVIGSVFARSRISLYARKILPNVFGPAIFITVPRPFVSVYALIRLLSSRRVTTHARARAHNSQSIIIIIITMIKRYGKCKKNPILRLYTHTHTHVHVHFA